ncbi:MAG: DNA topoisomerase IV subunit A, partial [Rhodobacteraceae bacterium]|nr:DNA topoisomerase IV subunit A [Paracoccaceae bacterium]
DGQGNFGNIDGDNPAASRYTEARLTAASEAVMDGLAEDAVDFRDNYDGTLREPVVMPAAFPNLLANGSTGIAVGMATNIPPHNLHELIDACLHLIKVPDARDATLLQYIPGPDFPTGGVIVEPAENIAQAYLTGRGGFRLRAKWEIEDLGRGQWQVIVTEIPYQVPKSRLIEKLAELIQLKKLPVLADVRDESAEDIRIVIEPRTRSVDPAAMMQMLFRASDLETRFSLNMNVLIDGVTPKVCSLKEVLLAFLDHRRDVLMRRSRYRLSKIDHRLEVLEGFITAFLNLDRVIDIIRYDDQPKAALMAEDWGRKTPRSDDEASYISPFDMGDAGDDGLTEVQAEAILNMRLRSLRRLEEIELLKEQDALMVERAALEDLLDSDALQRAKISEELRATRKTFGHGSINGARRTVFAEAGDFKEIPAEELVAKEPVTVVCSDMGWIRAMKGHIDLSTELKFKDGDKNRFVFHAHTNDRLLVFGENGRFYTILTANLPGGRGMGEPIRLVIGLPNESGIVDLFIHKPGQKLLVASSAGDGFIVPEDEVVAQTKAGKQVLNVRGGTVAKVCHPVSGDHAAIVGENRKVVVFALDELPEMGRGKGVRLQKYKDGGLSDATTFTLADGLSWRDPAGRTRNQTELGEWLAKRAAAGRMAPRGFPRDNKFN